MLELSKKIVFSGFVLTAIMVVYQMKYSWNSIQQFNTVLCPSKLALSWDSGRMGNQYFEYIAARLFAEKLGMPLYVTPGVLAKFQRYFNNFPTPAIDLKQLNEMCHLNQSNFTHIATRDLSKVVANDSTHAFVEFQGKTPVLALFEYIT